MDVIVDCTGSSILPRLNIGNNVIVGAGAVVIRSQKMTRKCSASLLKKYNYFMKKIIAEIKSSNIEIQAYKELVDKLHQLPISKDEILLNILFCLTRSSLSHILFFFNDIYSKIINKPEVIMEFGSRWGRKLIFNDFLKIDIRAL